MLLRYLRVSRSLSFYAVLRLPVLTLLGPPPSSPPGLQATSSSPPAAARLA